MVVDHQLRNLQLANRLGQNTETLHVGDVEHHQDVRVVQRLGALVAGIANVITQQELVHLRPRRRIHDARADPQLAKQARERGLRTAPVAISVDVGGYCDRASRAELLRETLDRLPSLLRDA